MAAVRTASLLSTSCHQRAIAPGSLPDGMFAAASASSLAAAVTLRTAALRAALRRLLRWTSTTVRTINPMTTRAAMSHGRALDDEVEVAAGTAVVGGAAVLEGASVVGGAVAGVAVLVGAGVGGEVVVGGEVLVGVGEVLVGVKIVAALVGVGRLPGVLDAAVVLVGEVNDGVVNDGVVNDGVVKEGLVTEGLPAPPPLPQPTSARQMLADTASAGTRHGGVETGAGPARRCPGHSGRREPSPAWFTRSDRRDIMVITFGPALLRTPELGISELLSHHVQAHLAEGTLALDSLGAITHIG
jgi:hypothetical protein